MARTNTAPAHAPEGMPRARAWVEHLDRLPNVFFLPFGHIPSLASSLRAAVHEADRLSEELATTRRQIAAPATAWWFDTGEFDYDPPRLHATEQGARNAAVEHWRHFNFPKDVEFAWLQEPDDDPDHPDPNRGFELVAAGRKTGHFVRPLPVQGATQTPTGQPARADLTRYPITTIDIDGRLAIWCTDCGPISDPDPIWTELDAAEQVTELCLANLVAIAQQHEREHHADDDPDGADAPPAPWLLPEGDD